MTDAPVLWQNLRRFTPARIALGRVGNAQPTEAHLAFQAAHAAARDAVHTPLDVARLTADLAAAGLPSSAVRSACPDRRTYLLRPDLGRRLDDADRAALRPAPGSMAFVIADGLSALAVQRHAAPLLAHLVPHCPGPIILASQARVALGDDIGATLQAEAVAVLIGERPGLSTPDSLGVYLTWQPRIGRTDAERNCISNIRPQGLPIPEAAAKLLWLIGQMRQLRLTGVALKDEQPIANLPQGQPRIAAEPPGAPVMPPSTTISAP